MWSSSPDLSARRAPEVRWISNESARVAEAHSTDWPRAIDGESSRTLSCVLPTHGNQRQVSQVLPRLTQALDEAGCPWELLVVVAGEVEPGPLCAWSCLPRVRVGVCGQSPSWAQALKAGFLGARGSAVLVADLGAAHKLDAVPAMVSSWDGAGQIVFADRRSGESTVHIRKCADDTPEFMQRLLASGVGAIDSDLYLMDRRVVRQLLR